jgi:hypothetical protein
MASFTMLMLVASPAGAMARPRPHVSIALPAVIEAGSPFVAQWKASSIPSGAQVVVQTPVGTAHVWKPVAPRLDGQHGTSMLPAYSKLGIYRLRLAVIYRGKTIAEQEQHAHVFATVPLEDLVPSATSRVYSTPSAAFPYILEPVVYVPDNGREGQETGVISDQHSECDSVHIDFVGRKADAGSTTVTATIVQQAAEPVSSTMPLTEPGTVEAHLALGQSWALNLGTTVTPGEAFTVAFLNGSAHCDGLSAFTTG